MDLEILIGSEDNHVYTIILHIAWFSGSDVRTSSNFAWSSCNVNGYNGLKWKEIHKISLSYYKTIVDLCFAGHELLLKGKLNHIDLQIHFG